MFLFKSKSRPQVDQQNPCDPFFLKAEDKFARGGRNEIFIKKIFSTSMGIPKLGNVIMAPGIATNANLYRMDQNGGILDLEQNNSYANLLAAAGFVVYLYHPGYTARVHNRYVSKHCRRSIHYGHYYDVPSTLDFQELVEEEVRLVIEFVKSDSLKTNTNTSISWIGYSLGGMLIYSYLSNKHDTTIKNVITIGSPITLSQIFIRIIPFANWASHALGFEESGFLGLLSENLIPITRIIRTMPGWLIRYNLLALVLYNPLNINQKIIKTLIGKVVEPIPAMLGVCFSNLIHYGTASEKNYARYLIDLRKLKKLPINFLFFMGLNDMIAPPDSIYLAHEIITPEQKDNLITVPSAGHIDLIVGNNAMENVWKPSLEWLQHKVKSI